MSDYLLIDGTQIPVTSELAQVVGLNEAIVLQEIHYWCKVNKRERRKTHDGYYWVYNSYCSWTENHFPWWSESTVRRTIEKLEARGLIVVGRYSKSKMNQTKWYRVNYPVLAKTIKSSPFAQNEQMDMTGLNTPMTEVTSERNDNGDFAPNPAQKSRSFCVENDNSIDLEEIDLNAFVDWYFELYMRMLGKKHPNIKITQRRRVIDQLSVFLSDHPDVDSKGLGEMAETFFVSVEESDWNINHFATPGILENRYLEVYCH